MFVKLSPTDLNPGPSSPDTS